MNAEIESARDDLAYMRALVGGTERRRHGEYIPRCSVPPRLRMLL